MPVRIQSGALTDFSASLQDFKNAFSLTDKGDFTHSVERTKGELYVNVSGRLASANIHGGKGTVTSSVTNKALRNALHKAFTDAGATEDFVTDMFRRHLPQDASQALSRKTVKELFGAFEQHLLERKDAVTLQAREAMTDASKALSLNDFRALARGTGLVGAMSVVEGSNNPVVIEHSDTRDADYNEALRRGLYAVVRDADVPQDHAVAKRALLERLARTLLARQNLGKPLSCDEIGRTLKALDEGLGYVPPRPLASRDIRALHKTGNPAFLSTLCKRCEDDAKGLDSFIKSEEWDNKGIGLEGVEALRRVAILWHEMAAIGRQALGQKIVDVDHAEGMIRAVQNDFCKANPVTLLKLAELKGYEGLEGNRYLQKALDLKPAEDIAKGNRFFLRSTTVPISSNSGFYVDKVLNNAAGGDCLFYAVADACKGLTQAANEPSDLAKANKMRAELATHIENLLRDEQVPGRPEDVKGAFTLHYDRDGTLRVPHSYGNSIQLYLQGNPGFDELTDPSFKDTHTFMPTVQLAFLADMIERPIVLLLDNNGKSSMLCYNRNLKTGEKLTGEPIALHFAGGASGHFQAVTLNEAGRAQLARLTMSDAAIRLIGNNDELADKVSRDREYDNVLVGRKGVDPASVNSPAVAEPVVAPRIVAAPKKGVTVLSAAQDAAIDVAKEAGYAFDNEPFGAKNVEVPGGKTAPENPPPPKISAHEQFVRDLYAEVSKLTTKRSVQDLDALVTTAKAVEKGAKKQIEKLVKAVKTSVVALNKLTGRQIANYSRGTDKAALKALTDVLKAHDDLALALTKLGAGKDEKTVRPLQAAADMLNRRICAITQLVGELNAQILRADSTGLDVRNQFDRVGQIAAQKSGAAANWMAKLKPLTAPLEKELERLTSTTDPITQETVDSARTTLREIRTTVDFLSACARDDRALTDEDKTRLMKLGWLPQEIVRVPQSAFEDVRQVLGRAAKQLGQAHLKEASKAAARRMVAALQIPGTQQINELKVLGPSGLYRFISDEGVLPELFRCYDACTKACKALRKAVQAELDSPNSVKARERVRQETENFMDVLGPLADALTAARDVLKSDLGSATGSVPKEKLAAGLSALNSLIGMLTVGEGIGEVIQNQINAIRDLTAERKDGRSWYDPQVMSRILDESDVFMTAVEARVHGIDLSLVDLGCSTKNLVKKAPIGSGTFSTAYLCTFKRPDGSTVQRVFKPDRASTEGLFRGIHNTLGGGTKGLQRALDYNVALHDLAMLLGAGSVICRSSAAYVDGEFGFLMEVAPGVDSKSVEEKDSFGVGPDGRKFTPKDFAELISEKKNAALAQMSEQLNRLQWIDLIGGQLDRHSGNYAVHMTKDGSVSIKGFDNDQSLAAEMVGIGKVRVPNWKYLVQKITRKSKTLNGYVSDKDKIDALQKELEDAETGQALYHEDEAGRVTIDVRKLKTAQQLQLLIDGTGLRSIAVPSYMDRDTYDRIKDLTKDEAGVKLFRETLAKRGMSAGQIDSAVKRLLEASNIADDLMKSGRVYTRAQMAKSDVLKAIFEGDANFNEMEAGLTMSRKDANVRSTLERYGSDYLHREPFCQLIKGVIDNEGQDYKVEVRPNGGV